MAWYEYLLIIGAGALAGAINTLAGSGSLITLPLLIFLGLPAGVANGTNRIGVLLQNVIAVGTIRSRSNFRFEGSWWIIGLCLIGPLAGAQVAVEVDERWMNLAIGILMIMMMAVVLLKPERWLNPPESPHPDAYRKPLNWLIFLAIGFYGAFIQAGVGIFLLAAMVLRGGYNLVNANAVKLMVVLVFTIPVLYIFLRGGQVEWRYGLLLAAGQMIGAWFAARFATGSPNASLWIRRLLIAVIAGSIIKILWPYAADLAARW